MIKQLIKLANHLDSMGLGKEADRLDLLIKKIAGARLEKLKEKLDGLGFQTSMQSDGELHITAPPAGMTGGIDEDDWVGKAEGKLVKITVPCNKIDECWSAARDLSDSLKGAGFTSGATGLECSYPIRPEEEWDTPREPCEVGIAYIENKAPPGFTMSIEGDASSFTIKLSEWATFTDMVYEKEIPSYEGRVLIEYPYILLPENIHFDFDKATIRPESLPLLDEVAKIINQNQEFKKISINGHTDNEGEDEFNLRLSRARAASVVGALVERGVSSHRLVPTGFGEQEPIATNETEEGRATNRRVEFVVTE